MITRNEIKKRLFELNNNEEYLNDTLKVEYYKRLSKAYIKKFKEKRFIMQYLDGDGNELTTDKFFNYYSSSRLCFELFSWMADEEDIRDLEFELHLPSMKSSHIIKLKGANMDCYYEKDDTFYFVESKFTEQAYNYVDKIPDAFYKELGEAKSVSGYPLRSTILYRFNNNHELSLYFPKFVRDIIDYIKNNNYDGFKSSFDIKQEIAHLFGIAQYIYKSRKIAGHRNIVFYNLIYNFNEPMPPYLDYFIDRATELIEDLIYEWEYDLSFSYEIKYMQDFVKEIPLDKKAFGSNKSIREILKNYDLCDDDYNELYIEDFNDLF